MARGSLGRADSSAAPGAKRQAFIAVLIGGIAWAGAAHADVTVCATGCTYRNIQTAVTNAADGETILIRAGIYPERLTIENKSLKLIGDGASVTVIDGTDQSNVSRVIALACTKPTTIVISDLTVTAGGRGGGIGNDGCKVSLEFSHVVNNGAPEGGGILNSRGAFAVFQSTISDNHALHGGGIANKGELEITESVIDNNSVRKGGGGVINSNSGRMTIVRSTISNNDALYGGAIANGGRGVIRKSVLSKNAASSAAGGVYNGQNLELVGTLLIAKKPKVGG